ncbi:hypothetical protein AVEN_177335-1 [Araneus ventricosus]|uniref:Uncharacterized protein n=1 Tax=Araneus ventricosus TaxID=182803 RepID=A0A4Y2C689_ARAVE|nr:hypothetical protein AVEN_177335-1 [Araneus ventricosus]
MYRTYLVEKQRKAFLRATAVLGKIAPNSVVTLHFIPFFKPIHLGKSFTAAPLKPQNRPQPVTPIPECIYFFPAFKTQTYACSNFLQRERASPSLSSPINTDCISAVQMEHWDFKASYITQVSATALAFKNPFLPTPFDFRTDDQFWYGADEFAGKGALENAQLKRNASKSYPV